MKYIHKSATFTKMVSDMGIERIGNYVQSMTSHANILGEMYKTGIINNQILKEEITSMSKESEKTGADLTLILHSLVRFIHTDSERIKSPRLLKTRRGKTRTPENEPVIPGLPVPVPAEVPKMAVAGIDTP